MTIGDIAKAVDSEAKQVVIGIRPGEKIHEQMIGVEDAPHTFEYDTYYKILPAIHSWSSDPLRIKEGKQVPDDFTYSSDNNSEWMSVEELKAWIDTNKYKIGQI
jgi:FlaA1/EpsC-like NDP-sugar epimerase